MTATDFAPGLERLFAFVPREGETQVDVDRGSLPADLRGTACWNGPGRFTRGAQRYGHWLDGDGFVAALRFAPDGTIHFVRRFVQSRKLAAEDAAGRPLFRAFGTGFPGDRLERVGIASPVNVSVYPWGRRLLAFGEQGLPWELDPETLETRREFDFGGALNPVSPWSAHPAIDRRTGELFGFGVSFAPAEPLLHVYRFARGEDRDETPRLVWRRRIPLPYPCSIHDFALSERHAVFYVAPYLLDSDAILRGGKTVLEALSWEPRRGSSLLVVGRETGEVVARRPIGERYCLHQINAFEHAGALSVDVVELDRPVYDQYRVPDLFPAVGLGRPVRYRLALDDPDGEIERRGFAYDRAPDFPVVRPGELGRRHDDCWMLGIAAAGSEGRKFFDQLVHLRWDEPGAPDLWTAPAGAYLAGEPVLARTLAADLALVPLFDAGSVTSRILVFDAGRVAAGPRAEIPLPTPLPTLFHGSFGAWRASS